MRCEACTRYIAEPGRQYEVLVRRVYAHLNALGRVRRLERKLCPLCVAKVRVAIEQTVLAIKEQPHAGTGEREMTEVREQ